MFCRKKDSQSGSVLVEATIVLPVLIFLIIGTLNIGLLFGDYLFLSQVAREVALRGSRIAKLSEGGHETKHCHSIPTTPLVEACVVYAETGSLGEGEGEISPSQASQCAHTQMCFYGQRLSATKKKWTVNDSVEIETEFTLDPDVPGLCVVHVTVSALYDGVFSLYGGTPIVVMSQAGYLSEPYTCT